MVGVPSEELQEHLFSLPLPHRAFSSMLQIPQVVCSYLPRCCSQSLRANLVPELTLSLPSAVVGVVRSSVDTGKARGRAPPSSASSTVLHNDSSCLGCAWWLSPLPWNPPNHSKRGVGGRSPHFKERNRFTSFYTKEG